MKICVLGLGVGGLTVLHELNKYSKQMNLNIELIGIERNAITGGQARSAIDERGLHTEYCWHALGIGYVNLIPMLQEIKSHDNKTVYEHLKPINSYVFSKSETNNKNTLIQNGNSFVTKSSLVEFKKALSKFNESLTFGDYYYLAKIYLVAKFASEKRLEKYDDVLWNSYMSNLSPVAKKWLVDSPAIFMGMDIDRLSSYLMLDLYRHTTFLNKGPAQQKDGDNYDFYCFDGPINKIWFDPWCEQLKNDGVDIKLNTYIRRINVNNIDHKITSIIINDGDEIFADIFVNSLDPLSFINLLPDSAPIKQMFVIFESRTRQIQTQVAYHLPKRLDIIRNTLQTFQDTPWFLMIRHEGNLWDLDDNDILSVGIGLWARPGLYHKKCAQHCTRQELAEECWYQLKQSTYFTDLRYMDGSNMCMYSYENHHNNVEDMPYWNIWHSFEYDSKTNTLETWEPKTSNGVSTLKLRPNTNDAFYINLKHANTYVRTDTNILSMESACEAGRKLSNEIACANTKFIDIKKTNWFISMIRKIDSYLC
jgi:15-cis-phytoene desaturase